MQIRVIRPDDGSRLRESRLRALQSAPDAFGSTYAAEAAQPPSFWEQRAAGGAEGRERITFIAEDDSGWLGIATGLTEPEQPDAPELVGMWVEPAARGRGIGAALVEAVVAWARSRGAARLCLWVTESNAPAKALYLRCGFSPTADAVPLPSNPALAERRMERHLRPA